MEGRRGGRKRNEVWDQVVKLGGNFVKCKHCEFQFAAASATRIKSHVYSIRNQGIRGCTFRQVANGSGGSVKNITRPGNLEAEEMAPRTDLVDITNIAPKKTKKRKVVAVEVEHAKHKGESSMEEVGKKESLSNFALGQKVASSPLDTSFLSSDFYAPMDTQVNTAHAPRTTSIWCIIELKVAGLEEKLDAFVARESKLQDEVANLKADLVDKIKALEAKAEAASQFQCQKFETEGKLNKALLKISSLTNQLAEVKAELNSVKSSHDVVAKENEKMRGELEEELLVTNHYNKPIYSPEPEISLSLLKGEQNFHSEEMLPINVFPFENFYI